MATHGGRDNGGVQDQQRREEKSLHIFVGVLVMGVVMVLGTALLWTADETVGLAGVGGVLQLTVEVVAVVAGIGYVYWHRRS